MITDKIISEVLFGIFGGMWTLVNMLFWQRIKRIETDVAGNQNEEKKIKENYIDRFERVYEKLNKMEINIIKHITDERN